MTPTKHAVRKRRLTELSVRKLKAESTAYQVWDSLQRGLCVRVQPSGVTGWYVVYSRHGMVRWLYLGDARTIGLADARTMAAETMLAVAKGKDPAAERKAERSKGTFQELAEQYVDEFAKHTTRAGGRRRHWCGSMRCRAGPSCRRVRSRAATSSR